jgi:1,4-dihydroxy-2-naphthoyl-CoA synthase
MNIVDVSCRLFDSVRIGMSRVIRMAGLQRPWTTLNVSLVDTLLTISMNRPKANAMSADLLNELIEIFRQASDNDHISGVLLRSNLKYRFIR